MATVVPAPRPRGPSQLLQLAQILGPILEQRRERERESAAVQALQDFGVARGILGQDEQLPVDLNTARTIVQAGAQRQFASEEATTAHTRRMALQEDAQAHAEQQQADRLEQQQSQFDRTMEQRIAELQSRESQAADDAERQRIKEERDHWMQIQRLQQSERHHQENLAQKVRAAAEPSDSQKALEASARQYDLEPTDQIQLDAAREIRDNLPRVDDRAISEHATQNPALGEAFSFLEGQSNTLLHDLYRTYTIQKIVESAKEGKRMTANEAMAVAGVDIGEWDVFPDSIVQREDVTEDELIRHLTQKGWHPRLAARYVEYLDNKPSRGTVSVAGRDYVSAPKEDDDSDPFAAWFFPAMRGIQQ